MGVCVCGHAGEHARTWAVQPSLQGGVRSGTAAVGAFACGSVRRRSSRALTAKGSSRWPSMARLDFLWARPGCKMYLGGVSSSGRWRRRTWAQVRRCAVPSYPIYPQAAVGGRRRRARVRGRRCGQTAGGGASTLSGGHTTELRGERTGGRLAGGRGRALQLRVRPCEGRVQARGWVSE